MTRRMVEQNSGSWKGPEHNELPSCTSYGCTPVEESKTTVEYEPRTLLRHKETKEEYYFMGVVPGTTWDKPPVVLVSAGTMRSVTVSDQQLNNYYEPVPEPFFEAGKTYMGIENPNRRFVVEYLSTHSETGKKAAFGWHSWSPDFGTPIARACEMGEFGVWREIPNAT